MDLVYQYFTHNRIPKYAKMSSKMFKKYAEMHGAEYHLETKVHVDAVFPTHESHRVWKDPDFDRYDKILVVDLDIAIADYSKNIFDEAIGHLAMKKEVWQEGRQKPLTDLRPEKMAHWATICEHFGYHRPVFVLNTGVQLWSWQGRQRARKEFMDPKEWASFTGVMDKARNEQCYLNTMIHHHDFSVSLLDVHWNQHGSHRFYKGRAIPGTFIHYTGDDGKTAMIKKYKSMLNDSLPIRERLANRVRELGHYILPDRF